MLRVYLFTRRHDRLAPRSRIAIARGDATSPATKATLERRFRSGVGFALAADYLSSPTASGTSSDYSNTQVWAQGGYVPSRRFGVQYQLIRSRPKRRPSRSPTSPRTTPSVSGYTATRTDAQFRLALRSREDGTGPGLDLIYARSAWDGAGLDQQINQIGGYAVVPRADALAGASGFHRTRWTPLDLRGTLGWTPIAPFTASAKAVLQHHFGGRSSDYVTLAAGLAAGPRPRAHRHGAAGQGGRRALASRRHRAAASATSRRSSAGAAARLGLQVGVRPDLGVHSVRLRRVPPHPALAPSPETEWLTVSAPGRAAPLAHAAELVQRSPATGRVDGVPPTHSLTTATIRSKFLRQFPSGIFDLKLQLEHGGVGRGAPSGATPRARRSSSAGATFFKSLVEIQLQSFTLYWDRGNLIGHEADLRAGIPDSGVREQFRGAVGVLELGEVAA